MNVAQEVSQEVRTLQEFARLLLAERNSLRRMLAGIEREYIVTLERLEVLRLQALGTQEDPVVIEESNQQ